MGKSLGNVLEPRALLGAYGADAVRFFFLKEVVFGQACTQSPPPAMPEKGNKRMHSCPIPVSS